MLQSFKNFLQSAWHYIEEVQTLKARRHLQMWDQKGSF